MPIAKVQSPLSSPGEFRVKVVLMWSKERPTLEREITFFDSSSQDPLTLLWSEDKALYQGNGSLSVGTHSGTLLFPTTGEMLPVQQFEVVRKQMGMGMIKLKLHEQYVQAEPARVDTVATGVGDRNEPVTKLGLALKERDRKIEEMEQEIEALNESNNKLKSDKQKSKQDLAKQDDQLIATLLQLSELRAFGSPNEAKLTDEIEKLKFNLKGLSKQPHANETGTETVLGLNETIRNLEGKVLALEEKEKELIELNATFGIMSKESNKLSEENVNLKTKQQRDEQHIRDLHDSVIEHKKRGEELTKELSEIQASASVAKEGQFDSLMAENSKLQNTNKELHEDLKKLETESNASIEELRETKEQQQQTIESNNKQLKSELREKDTSISKLTNQLETLRTQFGRERGEILKRKESELSDLKREFERTETELRHEVEQQKQELEGYQALCSKQEETAGLVGSLISEKSCLEQSIEELKQQNQKLTTEAAQQPDRLTLMGELDTANDLIMKLEQTSSAKEEQLSGKIQELWNGNMELTTNINTLNKQILEQNKQITSARGAQEAKEKSLSLLETKDKQISDLKIQISELQEKEQTHQTQMRELQEEIEQLKSDNEDLGGILNSEEKNEKLLASEKEISSLMEQIDAFRTQIDALTEAKRDNSLRIQELEGSYENLTNTSKDLEMQLGESKSECKKLEMGGEGNSVHSNELIDQLRKELDASKDELKSERQNSEIGKQLINKLNSDIHNFEKGNATNTADLERQLAESERARTAMEHKLGEMATEITNRDAKIRELEQNIGIVQNRSQVAHTTSTPVMPTNPSKAKDDKKAKVSKDLTKQKQTESTGATPSATFYDLTSHIVPVANTTGKSASKILLKPNTNVNVVKLKALPNPHEYQGKQAILPINKRYEIGVIMVIFELPGKVGLRSVSSKYVGIKLNNPVGNSGGEFRTKRYFECEPNCAIFAPFEDVFIPVA